LKPPFVDALQQTPGFVAARNRLIKSVLRAARAGHSSYSVPSRSRSFLYFGFRSAFGTMTRAAFTVPTRSRAMARISLGTSNVFLRGTGVLSDQSFRHARCQRVEGQDLI